MRRSFYSFVAFLFSLALVGVSIWRITDAASVTLAVGDNLNAEQNEETVIVTQVNSDEYSLPYPGMLPDHPVYFVKMLRDRIQLWITRNPIAKVKLMLHFADKRIASSLALAEKGKTGLAVTTATKAEQYIERALEEVETIEGEDEAVSNFYNDLRSALVKHGEVLAGVKTRLPEETLESIAPVLELQQNNMKRVAERIGTDEVEEKMEDQDSEILEAEVVEATEPAELEE